MEQPEKYIAVHEEGLKAEIERLRGLLKEVDVSVEKLRYAKLLLKRAAEALECYTTYPIGMVMSVTLRESGRGLIAEVRKLCE